MAVLLSRKEFSLTSLQLPHCTYSLSLETMKYTITIIDSPSLDDVFSAVLCVVS